MSAPDPTNLDVILSTIAGFLLMMVFLVSPLVICA